MGLSGKMVPVPLGEDGKKGFIEIAGEPPYAFEREVVSGELRVRERFEFRTLAELQEHVAKDKAENVPSPSFQVSGPTA